MGSNGLSWIVKEARRRQLFGVLAIYVVGAWIVLQVASTLFPGWLIPEEAIRYVWIGAVLLFPVALVFGWYYDVSVKGIRRTPSSEAGVADLPLTRVDYGVLSIVALISVGICLGVVVELQNVRERPGLEFSAADIPQNSIAVLPFVNMSDDESNDYFSDGISEQLLNELARIPDLHVAARTSSFYYKDKTETMRTMGRELGVRTLLEGSVRRAGNKVRITAQLINADDGYHLWSDTYDRELNDIFSVQDEIARAIINTLSMELLLQAQARLDQSATDNVEAYDLYLRAMAYRRSTDAGDYEKSNEYLQEAIDLAPDFALAFDALAYGYLLQSYNGSLSIDDATTKAEILLDKALELQPDLEQAHASFGLLKTRLGRYSEANEHYETALAINPNYFGGHVNYGLSLVYQSRLKEASAAYLRAQALDPLNAILNFNLGALLMLMGQFDDGYPFMQKAVTIDPNYRMPKAAATHWLGNYGKLVEAVQNGHRTLQQHPDFATNIVALIKAYTTLGLMDEAKQILSDAQKSMPENREIIDANVGIWLDGGDYDSFNRFAEEEFASIDADIGGPLNNTNSIRAYRYGLSMLILGNNELAAEIFYWVTGGEDGIAKITYDDMAGIKMLALSYRQRERDEEADALLNRCLKLVEEARENGWATPILFVRLAEIYALMGDTDNAVSNLDIAFSKGWRGLSTIEYGIFWQHLQDDPELNRIKVLILDDLEMQKKRLRESSRETDQLPVQFGEAA